MFEISLTYYLHLGKMELNPSPGKNERLQKLDLTSNLLKWRGLRTTNERLDPDITLTCLWELFCCFLLNLKWLLMLLEQFLWIVLVKAIWTRLFVIAHLYIIGGKIRKIYSITLYISTKSQLIFWAKWYDTIFLRQVIIFYL